MAQAMGSRSYGEDGLDQEMRTHVTYTLTVGHLAAPASQLVFGKTRYCDALFGKHSFLKTPIN